MYMYLSVCNACLIQKITMESHSYLDMLREPMCIHRSSVFSPELCDFFKLSLNQTFFIGVVRQFNEKYSKAL